MTGHATQGNGGGGTDEGDDCAIVPIQGDHVDRRQREAEARGEVLTVHEAPPEEEEEEEDRVIDGEIRPTTTRRGPTTLLAQSSKQLGQLWRELSAEKKAPWVAQAEQEKARYLREGGGALGDRAIGGGSVTLCNHNGCTNVCKTAKRTREATAAASTGTGTPKRPRSAFILFSMANRPALLDKMRAEEGGTSRAAASRTAKPRAMPRATAKGAARAKAHAGNRVATKLLANMRELDYPLDTWVTAELQEFERDARYQRALLVRVHSVTGAASVARYVKEERLTNNPLVREIVHTPPADTAHGTPLVLTTFRPRLWCSKRHATKCIRLNPNKPTAEEPETEAFRRATTPFMGLDHRRRAIVVLGARPAPFTQRVSHD